MWKSVGQDLSSLEDALSLCSCIPLFHRAAVSAPSCSLHAALMSLQWCCGAFLQAVQGNVMQTPLINHPVGKNGLNGTASSTSRTTYCMVVCVQKYIYSSFNPTNMIHVFFFFPPLFFFLLVENSSLVSKWWGVQRDTSRIKSMVTGIIHLWLPL